jgi:hypothetical protein
MEKRFIAGHKIRVSDDFFWAKGATGIIATPPAEVVALSGPWNDNLTRQEVIALNENTVCWIWIDELQFDANGDGHCRRG